MADQECVIRRVDRVYIATCVQIPGIYGTGKTSEEARADLWAAIDAWKEPSHEDLLRLHRHVYSFIRAQGISCPETVHQTDWVIENAYSFIEEACEIVGYLPDGYDD